MRWAELSWVILAALASLRRGAVVYRKLAIHSKLTDFHKRCTRYGLHVSRNATAALSARDDVLAFVQQVSFNAK